MSDNQKEEQQQTSGEWDSLLSEASEDSQEGFVKPNIEYQLSKEKRQIVRDILLEIRKFGVSQRQILFLIYLLALELENQDAMKAIVAAVGENREKIPLDRIEKPENKLILP